MGELFKTNSNFIIRDSDTKKILIIDNIEMKFKSLVSAKIIINNLKFGLRLYYEIYDENKKKIVYDPINYKVKSSW